MAKKSVPKKQQKKATKKQESETSSVEAINEKVPQEESGEEKGFQRENNQIEKKPADLKPVKETNEEETASTEAEMPSITDDALQQAQKELQDLTESESYAQSETNESNKTIFIKNLNYDIKENDLEAEFSKVGEVVRCEVPMHHGGARNSGFAFVEFKEENSAKMALKLDGKEVLGREIGVEMAKKQHVESKKATLFVKNLPFSANKGDLRKAFEPFGEIISISVPQDRKNEGRNKGFGFVDFKNEEDAAKALNSNVVINDRKCFMNIGDKSKKKGDREGRKRGHRNNGDSQQSEVFYKEGTKKRIVKKKSGDKKDKFDLDEHSTTTFSKGEKISMAKKRKSEESERATGGDPVKQSSKIKFSQESE
ncbi:RBM19 [Enterospora canceri]|uniref:RBM19 n=1 Tax=Enterospora canceri TaxID=1081671 RepID=A0A1Y1S8Z7_9MICR|nr:RBM19 [Enterospora canceri]